MSDETSAFDAARKAFAGAQQVMHDAALAEVAEIVRDNYEGATAVKVRGYYSDEGDIRIELVAVVTPSGDITNEIDQTEELANDALLYMGDVTTGDGYVGEHEIDLPEPPETECLGFLLEQSYGTAAIPEDWTPVQACDDCQKFESDEDAANAAAQAIVFEGLAPGGCEVKYFPGVRSEDGEDDYEPPGDWAVRPNAEVPR